VKTTNNIQARIAVATSTGSAVDLHFGQCSAFYIYDLVGEGAAAEQPFTFIETRAVGKACTGGTHSHEKFAGIASTLSDCSVVLCAQIGMGALRAMEAAGMVVFEVEGNVEAALEALSKRLYLLNAWKGSN
jgi:predicted Fe-Mo cluster-binding NifX family protein